MSNTGSIYIYIYIYIYDACNNNPRSRTRSHIARTASSCFFHRRRLRQLRGVVCRSTMQRFVTALLYIINT